MNQGNKTDNKTRVRIFFFIYELKNEQFVEIFKAMLNKILSIHL